MALSRNRNAERYLALTEMKNKSSVGSGFQCVICSLHWDYSGRESVVSVQRGFVC